MEYVTFGRTGLRVSVAGLGAGGHSRLGLSTGGTEAEAIGIVHAALDRGVNLIDTASVYGTEAVIGRALAGRRAEIVLATKASVMRAGAPVAAGEVADSLEASLRALDTDRIDIFQLHAVPPAQYETIRDRILPVLERARAAGKIRFIGITETAPNDLEHAMLARAIPDGVWDSAMVGFHMMHANARERVFPATRAHNVGTLLMFAVRGIFARPAQLAATLRELAEQGLVPAALAAEDPPLRFLSEEGGAASLTDAAYRTARHEPGVDVVLFGTGSRAHLDANIASILAPPLAAPARARLAALFSHLRGVGLDVPGRPR
ncbi:MAG: aldo/keto reductase [Rhodospirillales bacterium]|nr:aldo/keto reductase [Rhodospirillales bacterium]